MAKYRMSDALASWMRKRGFRGRLYHLLIIRDPWWRWGSRLRQLVGMSVMDRGDEPRPPSWFYVPAPPKHMWVTGYPRRRYRLVKNWEQMRAETKGLNEDQMYDWKAINASQDGDLQFGHMYWGGGFHGLDYAEQRLLLRYLLRWELTNWFGIRSWLWHQGLHNALHATRPGSCKQVPPRGSGGYDHWHCALDRGHGGLHRFRDYQWGEVGGAQMPAVHMPESWES